MKIFLATNWENGATTRKSESTMKASIFMLPKYPLFIIILSICNYSFLEFLFYLFSSNKTFGEKKILLFSDNDDPHSGDNKLAVSLSFFYWMHEMDEKLFWNYHQFLNDIRVQSLATPKLDQVWSILPALELLPSRESNTNAGKMDQTWSTPKLSYSLMSIVNRDLFLIKTSKFDIYRYSIMVDW